MNRDSPIKVLQVVHSLGMGGAETWLMEVLRSWSKSAAGHIDFLATSGKAGIFDDEARRLGAQIHYVPYGRASMPQFVRGFRKVLKDGRYDAIHDHQDYVSGWHFLLGAGKLPHIRVTHVHNPAYQIRNNYGVTVSRRLAARMGKALIARYATHITGTSRQVIREYGFDAVPFRRIPKAALNCGFDPTRFLGDPAKAKVSICHEFGWQERSKIILFAGRTDFAPDPGHPQNHKNSGFALSVSIECARKDASVRTLFVGAHSPATPTLQRRICSAGLEGRIKLVGIRTDIERLMLGSDVLLFPSRGEGLGMVTVEAQASGLPVVASTAVPRECVVVPELVRFQTLEAGPAQWAYDLVNAIPIPQNRDVHTANKRVAASPFAIKNSAGALVKLYSKGTLS